MSSSVKGTVLWFCGLSGSGKTTIANALKKELENKGMRISIVDGDIVRETLHRHLGFSPEDIRLNNKLIAELCLKQTEDYDFILVPIISPFKSSRNDARVLLRDCFVEVYVNSSLETCINRDVKGHYKKALAGGIKNFIGLSKNVPFEPPISPDIELRTEGVSVSECVQNIIEYMVVKNLL